MNKVILLRKDDDPLTKNNKWISIVSGGTMIVGGLYAVFFGIRFSEFMWFVLGLMFVMVGARILYNLIGRISKRSKLALTLKVNDEFIEFKSSLIKPRVRIFWKDVKSIIIKQYQVLFDLGKTREIFSYDSTPEISLEIKTAIREVAKIENIEVYP